MNEFVNLKLTERELRVATRTVGLYIKYDTGEENHLDKAHEILNVLRKFYAAASGRQFKRVSAKEFSEIEEPLERDRYIVH